MLVSAAGFSRISAALSRSAIPISKWVIGSDPRSKPPGFPAWKARRTAGRGTAASLCGCRQLPANAPHEDKVAILEPIKLREILGVYILSLLKRFLGLVLAP